MADNSEDYKETNVSPRKACTSCPHCGHELSPWQQVLLNIDRALVCKNCWYRIILDIAEEVDNPPPLKRKD